MQARLKERHLDRILAEELEASPAFASWILSRLGATGLPQEPPHKCSTIISFHRSSGETDIRAEIGWDDGAKAILHIEDKLGAAPQPQQAERYQLALAEEQATFVAALLVAPTAWIRRQPREASRYDGILPLEDVAVWLIERANELLRQRSGASHELAKRLFWRADVLSGRQARRAVYNTLHAADLTRWNEEAAAVIEAYNGLVLEVYPRQRGTGRNKSSRFIRFLEKPTPYLDGTVPLLRLKTKNANHPGRVSLELPHFPGDPTLTKAAQQQGFVVEITARGTLMITASSPALADLSINRPVRDQIAAVEAAAAVAQRLLEWWEQFRLAPL